VQNRLSHARLMLLFTPSLCRGDDPLAVLEAALAHVDVVQVRIKHPEDPRWVSPARDLVTWTEAVLERVLALGDGAPLVLVNDRVDVARALRGRGVAGVHLGADDCPPVQARATLGAEAVIGLSTHDMRQVARAREEPVNYLGFGPLFPTATKGYEYGLGPDAAWIADTASELPVFPIGGIDATNAAELARVGRAAVSTAILYAEDPGRAASELRSLLTVT